MRFETARVYGRLLADTDLDLYLALYTDISVMRYIAEAMTVEEATATFAKAVKHNADPAARARYWHLSHRRTEQGLGLAALVRDSAVRTRGELGLMLLPEAQHTGVGIQALTAVVDGVLSQCWALDINVLLGRHATDNISAGRLVEHLGFDHLGIDTPNSTGWLITAEAWATRLAKRDKRPQHPSLLSFLE